MTRATLKEILVAGAMILGIVGLGLWIGIFSVPKATEPAPEPPPIVLSPPPEVATADPELPIRETPPRPYYRPCRTDDACLVLVLRAPATWDIYFGYDAAVMSSAERAALRQRLAAKGE
jgi:hypothetical protein